MSLLIQVKKTRRDRYVTKQTFEQSDRNLAYDYYEKLQLKPPYIKRLFDISLNRHLEYEEV